MMPMLPLNHRTQIRHHVGLDSVGTLIPKNLTSTRGSATVIAALAIVAILGCGTGSTVNSCEDGTPSFTPFYWNDAADPSCPKTDRGRQCNNNCYNYANNTDTKTFAQPGLRSGRQYRSYDCSEIGRAAVDDGIMAATSLMTCPTGETLLALVIKTGSNADYHWYRRDSNGLWTHKPGKTEAIDFDNSSNTISDPSTADRGLYTVFCGYYCSCSSAAEGSGNENIQ